MFNNYIGLQCTKFGFLQAAEQMLFVLAVSYSFEDSLVLVIDLDHVLCYNEVVIYLVLCELALDIC